MSDKVEVIYIKENNSKEEFDLILKNETNYDKEEKNMLKLKSNYVDFEKSIEKLKKFCELREIETNKFMEEAVELIELDDQHIGDLKDCFVNNTNVYQVMYKMVTQYDNRNELPKNILCSFINYEKELLFNNCILMNTFISKNGNNDKLENCNFRSLIDLILSIDYHVCVYVDCDNNFKEVLVNNKNEIVDPFNKFRKNLNIKQMLLDTSYKMVEKNYLNFELVIVYNDNVDDKINEPISRLLHGLTKGDCLIYSKGKNSFNDLFMDDVLNLVKVWNKFTVQDSDFQKINKNEKNRYQLLNDRLEL